MEDCSPKSLAATAAERWAAVYQASPGWRSYRIPSGALLEEVYVRLCALGPNPDPDAVDAVTGAGGPPMRPPTMRTCSWAASPLLAWMIRSNGH